MKPMENERMTKKSFRNRLSIIPFMNEFRYEVDNGFVKILDYISHADFSTIDRAKH